MKLWEIYVIVDRLTKLLRVEGTTFHSHYDMPAYTISGECEEGEEVVFNGVKFFVKADSYDKINEVLAIPNLHEIFYAIKELKDKTIGKCFLFNAYKDKPLFTKYKYINDSVIIDRMECNDYVLLCEIGTNLDEAIASLESEYDITDKTMETINWYNNVIRK